MTLFAVWARDRAGALAERERVRPAHRARLRAPAPHAVRVVLAGPTHDDTTATMNGTLLVVEADGIEAVRDFVAGDPYSLSGVYASVEIRPFHCGLAALPTLP